jgi:hypothetical protein
MADEETHDVFAEDKSTTVGEAAEFETPTESTARTKDEVENGAQQEAETQTEASTGAEESEAQGEGTTVSETPADTKDSAVQAEKMIPESRLKAAVKDVNDRLISTQRELAAMKAVPTPDRSKDPDGYDRHQRIEMSRTMVSRAYKDYDAKIAHFQEMAKAEPSLNAIVANNDIPAQMAYDLATKDMELTELENLKHSPEYKEFLEFKKTGKTAQADTATQLAGKKPADAASKVPNLNRNAPNLKAAPKAESDELFADHYSSQFG